MRSFRLDRVALLLAAALAAAGCSRKAASIEVSPRRVVLHGIEQSQRLTTRVLDSKGEPIEDAPRATWSSASPEVATVDDSGRIVAKAGGKTTVTVASGEVSATIPVEVVDVSAIEVSPAQVTLAGPAGTSVRLTGVAKNSKSAVVELPLTWSTSDEKVIKVSPDGTVTSVGPGTAVVTSRIGDLQGASEVVVVLQEIARLEMRPSTALVNVGDSQRFEVVAFAPDGTRLENASARFGSSNSAVATIDAAGVAVGAAAGTATIRAELAGRSAEATLIVN